MDELPTERHLPAPVPQPGCAPVQYVPMPNAAPLANQEPVELPTLDFQGIFSVLARRKWVILTLLFFCLGVCRT